MRTGFRLAWVGVLLMTLGVAPALGQVQEASDMLPPGARTADIPGLGTEGLSSTNPSASRSGDELLRLGLPPMSGPLDPDLYRLGPGDVLQLQMWGRLTRSLLIQVGPEGVIVLPGSGSSKVSGMTLTDVRNDVVTRLKRSFRGVNVELRLARPRAFLVFLTGQVKVPGAVTATGTQRAADLLARDVLQDNASRRHIEVRHADGTREIADLDLFLRTGEGTLNPLMQDGDVIYVPVATDFVYTHGALARPGRFELSSRDSLLTLFRLAGDPIPAADIMRALLVRWKDPVVAESLWVRLDEVYSREVNPPLREGDRLYVYYLPQYHVQHEAYVTGEVSRPGVYPISEGVHRLSDLVRAAGGFLGTADLSAIHLHRAAAGGTAGDPELERLLRLSREQLTLSEYEKLRTKLAGLRDDYRVDWKRLEGAPQDLDLLLRSGDVIRVDRLVNSIRIDGEVRRPGIMTYRPGLRVSDYVRQAGGFTDRAWGSRIRITRAVTGQTLPARNVRFLDPGDFVWIPERPDRSAWDNTRDVLTALAQVATVIIAIRTLN